MSGASVRRKRDSEMKARVFVRAACVFCAASDSDCVCLFCVVKRVILIDLFGCWAVFHLNIRRS